MTGFDYAVLAVLVISLVVGLWRGLVSEVLALVTWIVALVTAKVFAADVAPLLAGAIKDATLQWIAAFAIIVVAVILLSALLRFLLRELLKAAGLGVVDRVLGGCFGFVRGVLIVMAFVLLAGVTAMPREPWWQDSTLAPPFETLVIASKPWLPAALAKRIRYR